MLMVLWVSRFDVPLSPSHYISILSEFPIVQYLGIELLMQNHLWEMQKLKIQTYPSVCTSINVLNGLHTFILNLFLLFHCALGSVQNVKFVIHSSMITCHNDKVK